MSEKGKRLLHYGITLAVGALIAGYVYFMRGGFQENVTQLDRYRLLCDVFTVPGLLLLLFALLIYIANEEFFTIFSYAFSYVYRMFIPGALTAYKQESYADYLERKREKGKIKGYSCIAVTGAIFLAVGLVFLCLFYQTYK